MIDTHEDLDIKDFIVELRLRGVYYDSNTNSHWVGSKPFEDENRITNNDMKTMCENYFKDDYKLLSNPEQRKLRVLVFKQLRGNKNNG